MRRIRIAVFLLFTAIVLYLLLHDMGSLYVFYPFRGTNLYAFIKSFRLNIMQGWASCFATCYLVDFLWFSSLLLFTSHLLIEHSVLKYFGAFCFALFTEILQLLIKALGTFDFYDVLLYAIVTGMFILAEKLKLH